MSYRLHQVNENIQRELSLILAESQFAESGLITLTHVLTSPDLRTATVWLSILNNPKSEQVIDQLNNRAREFYTPLASRLKMKYVPQLEFKLDEQGDEISKIDSLLDQIDHDDHE